MLSITSMISCVVLVLACCCSALPLQDSIISSTAESFYQEMTSDKTAVLSADKIDVMPVFQEETTSLPKLHSERSEDVDELSTSASSESPRLSPDTTDKSLTLESTSEVPSSNTKRDFDESSTTMKSSTLFAERDASFDESDVQVTTKVDETDKSMRDRALAEKDSDIDMATDTMTTTSEWKTEEPSSSVDAFGEMTGLLSNKHEVTTKSLKVPSRHSSTTTATAERSERDDETLMSTQSEVVMPLKTRGSKKQTMVPGKMTQTKADETTPKKMMMTRDSMGERPVQLDQGEN